MLRLIFVIMQKVRKARTISFSTANGSMDSTKEGELRFTLPEFSESRTICPSGLRILPEGCDLPYDLILGRDLLRELKISVDYSKEKVIGDEIELPMLKTD